MPACSRHTHCLHTPQTHMCTHRHRGTCTNTHVHRSMHMHVHTTTTTYVHKPAPTQACTRVGTHTSHTCAHRYSRHTHTCTHTHTLSQGPTESHTKDTHTGTHTAQEQGTELNVNGLGAALIRVLQCQSQNVLEPRPRASHLGDEAFLGTQLVNVAQETQVRVGRSLIVLWLLSILSPCTCWPPWG